VAPWPSSSGVDPLHLFEQLQRGPKVPRQHGLLQALEPWVGPSPGPSSQPGLPQVSQGPAKILHPLGRRPRVRVCAC